MSDRNDEVTARQENNQLYSYNNNNNNNNNNLLKQINSQPRTTVAAWTLSVKKEKEIKFATYIHTQ